MARYLKKSQRLTSSYADEQLKQQLKAYEDRAIANDEARKKAREEAVKKQEAEKVGGLNIWNEIGDSLGTAAKGLTKFGATVANDVATGFNEKESRRRTDEFMKSSGAEKWDETKSYSGDLVGGLAGGIPQAIYDPMKQSTRGAYNVSESTRQMQLAEDARQAQINWRENPKLMSKTLKPGETKESVLKRLDETIKKNSSTNEQKYVQDMDATKEAASAAENVINLAFFGAGSFAKQLGQKTATKLPTAVAGLGKDNTTRKIVADTLLGTGQVGAGSARTGEAVDAEDVGVATGMALLSHGRGYLKRDKTPQAASQSVPEAQKQLEAGTIPEPEPVKQLPELTISTQSEMGAKVKAARDGLDAINNGDMKYMEENGLLNKEAGDKRFKELTTENPEVVKASQEAAKVLAQADDQVKYYNDIKASSKYFRQVDRLEQQRKTELDRLGAMADDPAIPADRVDMETIVDGVNQKYDAKLEELSQKYPEDAAEKPMLDAATEQATIARMEAQDNLDNIVKSSRDAAFKEANSIAMTPNADKIKAHKEALIKEHDELVQKLYDAEDRFRSTNETVNHVDKEIEALQDGTHPLRTNGAPASEIKARFRELQDERANLKTKETLKRVEKNPEEPITEKEVGEAVVAVAEEIQVPTDTIDVLRQYAGTPNKVLRKIGLTKLADTIEESFGNYRAAQAKVGARIMEIQEASALKGKSLERVADALDGKEVKDLTNGEKIAIKDLTELFQDYAKKLGLPEERRISKYFPHIFENSPLEMSIKKTQQTIKTMEEKLLNNKYSKKDKHKREFALKKQREKLRELSSQRVLPIELSDVLVNNEKLKTKAGNIDFSRLTDSDNFIKDPFKVAAAYAKQAERRINMEPAFKEMNRYIGSSDINSEMASYIQRYGRHMMGYEQGLDRWVNGLTDSVVNSIPGVEVQNSGTKAIGVVRSNSYRSNLQMNPATAIRNLTQGTNTIAVIGFKSHARGTLQLLREMAGDAKGSSKMFTEMRDVAGIFDDTFHQHGEVKMVKKFMDKVDKAGWAMFTFTEKINRGSAYLGARAKYLDTHPGDIQGAIKYASRVVSDTQFHFNDMELPPILRSKTGRGLAQYQSFNIKQAEFLLDMFGGGAKELKQLANGEIKMSDMVHAAQALRWSVANLAVTGMAAGLLGYKFQDAIPNPLDPRNFGSPMMQLMLGDNKTKDGIQDVLFGTTKNTFYDYTDADGNKVSKEEYEANPELYRAEEVRDPMDLRLRALENFVTDTIPGVAVPWYTQIKKTTTSLETSDRGYGETPGGSMTYRTDERDLGGKIKGAVMGESTTKESQGFYKDRQYLSRKESQEVKNAPKDMQRQYYDFFRAADKITGRSQAEAEIYRLYDIGQVQRARDKTAEFNGKVDAKMSDFFSKYEYIDPDLEEKLKKTGYITITKKGEESRMR